jgi:chromate transporter
VVADLLFFFFKTGLLVFGSGLVIVPFLKAQVVDQYHWLTNQQFLDSVAIGMISPGPVVITATFVGYLLAGFLGAVAATCGIFAAPVLFVLIATPLLRRYRDNAYVRGFVRGIGSAVVGVLVATAWLIARTAIADWRTLLIAVLALIALAFTKTPEPAVIATAGVIGLLVSV